jgi:hypothetical protein
VSDTEGSDLKVTKFANAVKKVDMQTYIIDYLEDAFPKDISESVQLEEAAVSDGEIKKVLLQISRVYGATNGEQKRSVRQYLKRWTNEFAKVTDPAQKQKLAGEAVNYLFDRQSYDEYQDAVNAVTKVIRNSDLDEKVKRDLMSDIANRKIYRPRETVGASPKEKPRVKVPNTEPTSTKSRAQVRQTPGEKPRVRPAVESMSLAELQKVFEDAIIRNTQYRYGRTRREAL